MLSLVSNKEISWLFDLLVL